VDLRKSKPEARFVVPYQNAISHGFVMIAAAIHFFAV
jgi:predicted membrane channel-forming protein YqfA (hemolysin III family)